MLVFRDGHARRLWLARLAEAGLGAALGVEARTLEGLALALLERAGTPAASRRRAELEFGRALEDDARLQGLLAALEGGREALWASLGRWLEAGYTPALQEPLEAALAGSGADPQAQALGLATLRLARRLLERCPGARPAAFAAAELPRLPALLADQRLLLVDPDRRRPATRDLARALEQRAGARALELAVEPLGPRPGRIRRQLAADPRAEVRLALEFCQRELAAGLAPERVAVVLYGADERRAALSVAAQRLALPFSAPALWSSPDAAARRLLALADWLRGGAAQRLTRLLDCMPPGWIEARFGAGGAALRLGARVLGAVTVQRGAELDLPALLGARQDLALPVRLGPLSNRAEEAREASGPQADSEEQSEADEDAEADDGAQGPALPSATRPPARLARQRLPRTALERLRELCADALQQSAAEAHRPLADRAAELRAFADRWLGWREHGGPWPRLEQALHALQADLGADFALAGAEWCQALAAELEQAARGPLGGRGAGIQVGGPDLPRAPFDRIVIVGLDQASAQRRAPRDAFLGPELTAALGAVLPDIGLGGGLDPASRELETFLSLADLAPQVLLLCAERDLDDRERAPSALFGPIAERLEAAPALPAEPGPQDLFELAVEQAPELRPEDLEAWFLGLAPGRLPERLRRDSARGRAQVLREWSLEPKRAAALGPSPYHGCVGRIAPEPISVTLLESLAKCGWRTFLERRLRLEPAPNPEFAWPPVDARLVGELLHGVLERLVRSGPHVAEGAVGKPGAEAIERALRELGAELAREKGLTLPGFERVLIERARRSIDIGIEEIWAQGPLGGPQAEWEGEIALLDSAGSEQRLTFRADRRDQRPGQSALLTDYKSGRCFADGKKDETVRRKLLSGIRRGERLQAVAYALGGAEQRGHGAVGRYLFLAPAKGDEQPRRILDVDLAGPDGPELLLAFKAAAATLLSAWSLGALAPRLLDSQLQEEPAPCANCTVREACVQRDSGQRRRFGAFIEGLRMRGAASPAEAALLEWFELSGAAAAQAAGEAPEEQP